MHLRRSLPANMAPRSTRGTEWLEAADFQGRYRWILKFEGSLRRDATPRGAATGSDLQVRAGAWKLPAGGRGWSRWRTVVRLWIIRSGRSSRLKLVC